MANNISKGDIFEELQPNGKWMKVYKIIASNNGMVSYQYKGKGEFEVSEKALQKFIDDHRIRKKK